MTSRDQAKKSLRLRNTPEGQRMAKRVLAQDAMQRLDDLTQALMVIAIKTKDLARAIKPVVAELEESTMIAPEFYSRVVDPIDDCQAILTNAAKYANKLLNT